MTRPTGLRARESIMNKVDQFESMFRAAGREVFRYEPTDVRSVLVVTDRDTDGAKAFGDAVRRFLGAVAADESIPWRIVGDADFRTAGDLLELVESVGPGLVCTYRNLHSTAWRWPYSLGAHLDVLTQHTSVPVMVLPHPEAGREARHAMEKTRTVMAITDHLTGDQRLVNYSAHFTEPGGTLWLTHIEDEVIFERYIEVISKIPSIDTDDAREVLRDQLLKEPANYIQSCVEGLRDAGPDRALTVEALVTFGHHLSEYEKLIEQHEVDLLVMNTKDEDQLAMRGMAYELAVELRHIPLLML